LGTALQFHDLTSEVPRAVWLMIATKGHRPKLDFVKTELVYASGLAFTSGVDDHTIAGVRVRITDPAKTVADCFRYRSRVGMEVAYTALRDYLEAVRQRRSSSVLSVWSRHPKPTGTGRCPFLLN